VTHSKVFDAEARFRPLGARRGARRLSACLLAAILALGGAGLRAEGVHIRANALFDGRAVLTINGHQQMLKVGQRSAEGVLLVSANASNAVVEIGGRRQTLALSREISAGFAEAERSQVAIQRNGRNEYVVAGSINGRQLSFLVDTGATVIAMNGNEARRLGIDFRLDGSPTRVQTASGVVNAWAVSLERVEIAGITVRNVAATVLEGAYPVHALLGMSFLSRVGMREDSGVLYLEQ